MNNYNPDMQNNVPQPQPQYVPQPQPQYAPQPRPMAQPRPMPVARPVVAVPVRKEPSKVKSVLSMVFGLMAAVSALSYAFLGLLGFFQVFGLFGAISMISGCLPFVIASLVLSSKSRTAPALAKVGSIASLCAIGLMALVWLLTNIGC